PRTARQLEIACLTSTFSTAVDAHHRCDSLVQAARNERGRLLGAETSDVPGVAPELPPSDQRTTNGDQRHETHKRRSNHECQLLPSSALHGGQIPLQRLN